MKKSMKTRLGSIETKIKRATKRYRSATVVCDPEIMDSFDVSLIEADFVLVLPDNGRRVPWETVPKGSYLVHYL